MRLAVLGESLLSRHFVTLLNEEHPAVEIKLWTFFPTVRTEFECVPVCFKYYGPEQLCDALREIDIAINFHEYLDLSLAPNSEELQRHNVEFVRSLIFRLRVPFIHISTCFLQCSTRWPNGNEPESDPRKYESQWPFPEYCRSKFEAEMLVKSFERDAFVLRAVPVYGEGDDSSIITDLIRLANDSCIPLVGDGDGVMQMSYVRNSATAVWLATCRLLSLTTSFDPNATCSDLSELLSFDSGNQSASINASPQKIKLNSSFQELDGFNMDVEKKLGASANKRFNSLSSSVTEEFNHHINEFDGLYTSSLSVDEKPLAPIFEIILIADDTPKKCVHKTFAPFLFNGKRLGSQIVLPFLPVYYIYSLLCFLLVFLTKFFHFKFVSQMPHPSFLYVYFRHWTFFNTNKSLLYLNYKPKHDYQEGITKSSSYYRHMRSDEITNTQVNKDYAQRLINKCIMADCDHEMIEHDDMVEVCSVNGRRAISSGVPSLDGSIDSGDERALSDSDIAHAARINTIATTVKGPSSDDLEEECRQQDITRRLHCHDEETQRKLTEDGFEDLLGTGALFMKSLRSPDDQNSEKPVDNQWVTVNIIDTLRGKDSHSNLRFLLGSSMTIDAWEIVIKLMKVGEIVVVKTEARLAYGELGLDDLIEPEEDQEYTIELLKVEDGPDAEMSVSEKINLAEMIKERGKFYFKRAEYEKAVFVYKRVHAIIGEYEADEEDELSRILSTCSSNLAICYAQMENWQEVLEWSEKALELWEANTKATYWHAKGLMLRNDLDDAFECIEEGLKQSENDPQLLRLRREVFRLSLADKEMEKEVCKRMMSGLSVAPPTLWDKLKGHLQFLNENIVIASTAAVFIAMFALFLYQLFNLLRIVRPSLFRW
ncbi:unnamed protein product [Caenorhabditis auriculariae]|uniref:peptidylprolyl isomerase n=1 Tax=Caenorhabditis auriculariae TaxID=2777116 RepID=A0A8S1GPC1_9PELO|nr:unnamed protein product [Caenorhabditis auriculariae]